MSDDNKHESSELTPEELEKLAAFKNKGGASREFSVHSAQDRERIQIMARAVKQAVIEIIDEHGGSEEPDFTYHNLAANLQSSLVDQIKETGQTTEELITANPTRYGLLSIISLDFAAVDVVDEIYRQHPKLDVMRNPEDSKVFSREQAKIKGEMIGSFARKLGFLSLDESLSTGNKRVNVTTFRPRPQELLEGNIYDGFIEVAHPVDPFILKIELSKIPVDYKDNPNYQLGDEIQGDMSVSSGILQNYKLS